MQVLSSSCKCCHLNVLLLLCTAASYASISPSLLLLCYQVCPTNPFTLGKFSAHNLRTTLQTHAKKATHHHTTSQHVFLHDYFNVPLFETKGKHLKSHWKCRRTIFKWKIGK
jgi:hypothetical protein